MVGQQIEGKQQNPHHPGGATGEKTVFIVMAQAFRKRGSFSSRHKMLKIR